MIRVQNLTFRLHDIGKQVDDDMIMAKITTTLSSKYHAVKNSWGNVPESAQSISNLLEKLLQEKKYIVKEEQVKQWRL